MLRAIFILSLLAPFGRADTTLFCAWPLANVGEVTDPGVLVQETYRTILNSLGTHLSPPTLRTMAASKDPFAVPEERGADRLTLERTLRKFSEMVAAKGWNTEPIRATLIAELTARASVAETMQTRANQIVSETWGDRKVTLPEVSDLLPMAGGKKLLGIPESDEGRKRG